MIKVYQSEVNDPFHYNTIKKYFKILYPNIRKMKGYEDYCNDCFELERDIISA